MFEVGECVAYLRAMADIKVSDEVIEDTAERKVVTRFTPLGVVGAIVPWIFPCL
jgi:acyl-CoA reductase-like NAD-dependent aldehyde dehydrogenase